MKIRYLILLLFILIIPASLYFTIKKYHSVESTVDANLPPPLPSPPMPDKVIEAPVKQSTLPIQTWQTENGMGVYFVATEGIPIVDIEVTFDAGSARDGLHPGLSHLCTVLLDEGVADLTADEIAAKFEDTGTQYRPKADRDRAKFSLRTLQDPKLLDPMVELFATLLASPTFPETNVVTLKNQTLVDIKHNLQNPSIVANHAFFKAIYQDHPYAHPGLGTETSVLAITREDLIAFHRQFFVSNNGNITIVGGISKEYAIDLANRIAKKLPTGNKADPLPEVPTLTAAIQEEISFPAEQAHIFMGQPCAVEGDPDYFPLLIGHHILGGSPLTSRLFKEIRDNRGLVYHVSTALSLLQRPGPFAIKLQTKHEQTNEAIALLKENLVRFIQEGPTAEEVSEAKEAIIRALPLEINTNAKIKDFVATLAFYKLPLDFLNTYRQRIEAVSLEDIKKVFQQRIHPENMALIVVGRSVETKPN